MKSNALAREEEIQKFPFRYIDFVRSPDGHVLQSNPELCEAFQVHFCDHFARCLGLLVQEFRSYSTDFPHLREVEAASCEGLVTECEVRDALKQISLNKSRGLDDLPYEVYLKLPHMFVPILTDRFNHWFAQGVIPGSMTKVVITLLKKGGRYLWAGLDD